MSEKDLESQVLSEDKETDGERLVPVAEAIRYRKRAQSAEKQLELLEKELGQSKDTNELLSRELDEAKLEQALVTKLSLAGAMDLEAAVLMAKTRLGGSDQVDVDSVVEQLRKDKHYLFSDLSAGEVASKTSGVKDRSSGGRRMLEGVAKKAAASGSRNDVQEYMRMRRQFV